MFRLVITLLMAVILVSCNAGDSKDKQLTKADSLKLKMLESENVAFIGAPPVIPKEHPVIVGEDIESKSNGGEACNECHNNPEEKDIPQTLHPEMYNCLQCHIQQTNDEGEMVIENTFEKEKFNK